MGDRPNILIFMTDHQRADSVLPEHPARTPNVSKLFEQGVAFTNTFCPSPHCCPSRTSFFSGLYPTRHGVWNNICNDQALSRGPRPGVRLWSEDLAEAGYQLHFMGKWHVSVEESPRDRGWTEHTVSGAAGTHHGWTWNQFRELAARSEPTERGEGGILRPGYGYYRLYGETPDTSGSHDETCTAQAIGLLRQRACGEGPWCIFVGLHGPHDPYFVPKKYVDMYDLDGVPLPPSWTDSLEDKPRIYRRMRCTRFGQLSEREAREGIRHYWAYCTYLDELFGRVMEALDESGQAENTLVLYCSDHADYCGEHGLWAKGIPCFKGAYNVPAVMRWPAGIKMPGRRVDEFVSLCDFAPTFLELAGVESERSFSGASLVPFLRAEKPGSWRDEIHSQCNGVELYYTQRSVMTKDFKYVFNGFDDDELYDLRSDPHEMKNLSAQPAYERVKLEMCRRMWRFAYRENDSAINPYITVGLAPYGPAEAFRGPDGVR
jgi:arylsulfatase A-like enzyme